MRLVVNNSFMSHAVDWLHCIHVALLFLNSRWLFGILKLQGIWQDAVVRIRMIPWHPHPPHNQSFFLHETEKVFRISDKAAA